MHKAEEDSKTMCKGKLMHLLGTIDCINLSRDIFEEDHCPIGHGGYCDVFTAKSKRHGNCKVAVKKLRIHILQGDNAYKVSKATIKFYLVIVI